MCMMRRVSDLLFYPFPYFFIPTHICMLSFQPVCQNTSQEESVCVPPLLTRTRSSWAVISECDRWKGNKLKIGTLLGIVFPYFFVLHLCWECNPHTMHDAFCHLLWMPYISWGKSSLANLAQKYDETSSDKLVNYSCKK